MQKWFGVKAISGKVIGWELDENDQRLQYKTWEEAEDSAEHIRRTSPPGVEVIVQQFEID